MDNNEADIFANTLKNYKIQKSAPLYSENKNVCQHMLKEYNVLGVLLNISNQIKAFQNADNIIKGGNSRNNLVTYKTNNFLPINMMSTEKQSEQIQSTKFETQCVLDTQLINIIENAEALIDVSKDMTQEFETTFNNLDKNSDQNEENPENKGKERCDTGNDLEAQKTINKISSVTKEYDSDKVNISTEVIGESEGPDLSDFEVEEIVKAETKNLEVHNEFLNPKSPILNNVNLQTEKSKTPSPLVFQLESFEKFETIAISVIKDNPNFEAAKKLINSQIMNNELFIQSHAEPVLGDRDKSLSPILKLSKPHAIEKDIKVIDTKNTSVIEDNILFSSDEEDDFKSFEDVPLTCALETSFYNQHNVLDKTMYVGFQTASNKSIQVHTDTYSKAKSILDNVKIPEEEYISLTKLVEVIDSHSNINNNTVDFKRQNNTKLRDKDSQHNMDFESGQEYNKYEEILINSKRNFEEVIGFDDDQNFLNVNLEHNVCNNKKIKLSENTFEICEKNTENNELNTNNRFHKDNKCDVLKEIAPLSEHLNIDEHVLKEFENNFTAEDNCIANSLKTDKNNKTVNKDHSNLRSNIDAVSEKFASVSSFEGFKTANNKKIKISQQGLAKTRNIFEGINLNDLEENPNDLNKDCHNNNTDIDKPSTSKDFVGFRTANNKAIKVSELALAKTRNIFEGINSNDLEENPKDLNKDFYNYNTDIDKPSTSKDFVGFRTANNKAIKVSELALAKTRNIFEGINSNDLEENPKDLNKDFYNYNTDIDKPSTSKDFVSFRIANNKAIKVPELALAKTSNIFDDIDNEDILPICNVTANADKVSVNKNKCNTEGVLTKSNLIKAGNNNFINPFPSHTNVLPKLPESPNKVNNVFKQEVPTFIGFQTASNKTVKISEEALTKSKNIFKEIMCDQSKNETYKEVESIRDTNLLKEFETHTTESKHSSANNLQKGMTSFFNIGFKTANNKAVKVSNEALEKSRKVFQDIGFTHPIEDVRVDSDDHNTFMTRNSKIEGFKTASKKPVSISDESLAKTKNIFQDIDNLYNKDTKSSKNDLITEDVYIRNPSRQGFRTASNKPVTISEEALAKSKKVFQDLDVCENQTSDNDCVLVKDLNKPIFEGFKTANNKSVKISEDALAKLKQVFQDLDKDERSDDQNSIKNKENAFIGFQTANKKTVKISKEELLKSKEIFEGIDLNENFEDNKKKKLKDEVKSAFGFKTANNKNVNVSEDSLQIAKKNFNDKTPDNDNNTKNITEVNATRNDDYVLKIDELMNTEVIKNLEESLNTEDFSKDTSPISKRSGSPILSCPKAKKRKVFKTPQVTNKSNVENNHDISSPTDAYIFNGNYKKNKKYTLRDVKNIETSNPDVNVDSYTLKFKFDTLLNFEFRAERNDIDSDVWTTDKIKKYFTESVNRKIIPEGWIENHLKLIIWKLISYEIYFPSSMENICTIKNVLHQLKYRYDRELYNVERPALRKILEKDEVSIKLMVLCVAGLYVNGVCVSSVTNQTQNIELLLTDGWYCIKACGDRMIDKLICDGKICVGTKLAVHGAELMNCEQGIAPWEDTSSICLKISGNSIRRAKWDTRLGFHSNGAILTHLSAVKPEGGKISRLRVFVTRVYPMLYVEKFEDGSTVTRSERLEHLEQMKHEADRQNQMEKLYDELEKMTDQGSQDSEGLDSDKGLDTGSQIYRFMKRSKDSSEFRVNLTESQTHLLQEHTMKKHEKLIQNMQKKVQELVKKRGLDVARNVVPLLKIRVADVHNDCVSKAMITIWRPNECFLDLITEGSWLDVYNVVPTAVRFSEIQISAGRQSIFQPSKSNKINKLKVYTDSLKRKFYPIRDLQHTITTDYNEIDTIGLIFSIEPSTNQFQNIYLTDENKNIISVNFWGGIKKFGYENIIDTGQVVACVNLQKRTGNTKKQIPQYRATELTHFTRTCKIDSIRKMTEDLSTKFLSLDKKKFINDCVAIKNNFTNFRYGNTENVTPYRLNNSDYNITKNKLFIDSPLAEKVDINLNLSGLDFESTFKQTDTQDISPERLLRKRKVNEKIAKLKMYGEPPPLRSIHIINKPNAIKPYKSPLISKSDISLNVASVKNLPDNCLNSSPVLINRTYVKSINPVKLNFGADEDNESNTTDPFAEEFDCSPPLSLD